MVGRLKFKALGNRTVGPLDASGLETFAAPSSVTSVKFTTDELCAMCPVTHQPDLYHAEIVYIPTAVVVESKTLKLYLNGFRNVGVFGEDLAAMIAADLNDALDPEWITVTLVQQVRGGLTMTAKAEHART